MKVFLAVVVCASGLYTQDLYGQKLDPVQWTLTSDFSKAPPGSTVPLKLTAKLQEGWHVYSLTTPEGGPIPSTAVLAENPAIEKTVLFQPKPERKLDANFGIDTETFGEQAVFLVNAQVKKDAAKGETVLEAQVRYQSCNDRQCLPPRREDRAVYFDSGSRNASTRRDGHSSRLHRNRQTCNRDHKSDDCRAQA